MMKANLQPCRLQWRLATPMVSGAHPLHLDALVAYAVTENAVQSGVAKSGSIGDLAVNLPLGREQRGDQWCWQASALKLNGGPHSMRFWTRKTDSYDYARRVELGQIEGRFKFPLKPYAYKVDTQRGIFKQQFKFFPVRQVDVVTAWCIGDKEALEELLHPDSGFITHIGAKARMGYGRVASFAIDIDETAHTSWTRRVLPWPIEGAVPQRLAVRPPYWCIENVVDSYADPSLYV